MWSSAPFDVETQEPNLPQELLEDFLAEFNEIHHQCEATLMRLERAPDDRELVRSLFRAVHTVKGNLSYVYMNGFVPLLQSVEDVLDEIRHGRMAFDNALSDIILLSLDLTQRLVDARGAGHTPPLSQAHYQDICTAIRAIVDSTPGPQREQSILRSLRLLDPQSALDADEPARADGLHAAADASSVAMVLQEYGVLPDQDLIFFQGLMAHAETRSIYWTGRTERLLRLALAMNRQAGAPVDALQLAVAVVMHDIGMAFLPLEMLHKREAYSEEERWLLRSHPLVGMELLARMPRWRPAAEMVFQHHERSDGSGYPQGLKEGEIGDGAVIIGIAESFDARTQERAHRTLTKRPFIRAVLEINNCSGLLFPECWVQVFNETIRTLQSPAEQTVH